MFNKILIAEDQESASISVRKTLEDLSIHTLKYAYYCDDALLQIKNSLLEGQPFDLLITDLYFEADHREQKLEGGRELIAAARQLQPHLPVLIFSAEDRPVVVNRIFEELAVNGYVRKGRFDVQELKAAIGSLERNKRYLAPHFRQARHPENTHDFTKLDIAIVTLLAEGVRLKDMPDYLVQQNIKPSSLSSVEKRLNLIKENLKCTINEQLVAYCKDADLI